MNTFENDTPKKIKKKPSDKSKSKKKSNHKHIYKDCLFVTNNKPYKGKYCEVCGKIGEVKMFELMRSEGGWLQTMRPEDIFAKYKDLERVEVENIIQKYIVLENNKVQGIEMPDDYNFEVGM